MANVLAFVVIAVVFCFSLARRMRPQPVRPQRLMVTAVVIVGLLVVFAIAGSAYYDQTTIALAPVALVLGAGLGLLLVRTTRFWVDERSGDLWMGGGWVFAVVLMGTIALRVGLRYAAESQGNTYPLLTEISGDLLVVSVAMWLTRAVLVYRRWQQHQQKAVTT